jgi:hypothetical protein
MTLTDMLSLLRLDLHDEDSSDYRWTDDELSRHIAHAVKDFSEALPLHQKSTLATTPDSREISLADLIDRIMIKMVEYPLGQFPPSYPIFEIWGETLTLLGEDVPDGSDCCLYYGRLHTLDNDGSTIPSRFEDLVIAGASGYAALQMAFYSLNRVNNGGATTSSDFVAWGSDKMIFFRAELKRLGRRNHLRPSQLYIT